MCHGARDLAGDTASSARARLPTHRSCVRSWPRPSRASLSPHKQRCRTASLVRCLSAGAGQNNPFSSALIPQQKCHPRSVTLAFVNLVGTKRAFIDRETGRGPQEKPFEGTENILLSTFQLHQSYHLSSGLTGLETEGYLALTTSSAGVAGQIQVYFLGQLTSNKDRKSVV